MHGGEAEGARPHRNLAGVWIEGRCPRRKDDGVRSAAVVVDPAERTSGAVDRATEPVCLPPLSRPRGTVQVVAIPHARVGVRRCRRARSDGFGANQARREPACEVAVPPEAVDPVDSRVVRDGVVVARRRAREPRCLRGRGVGAGADPDDAVAASRRRRDRRGPARGEARRAAVLDDDVDAVVGVAVLEDVLATSRTGRLSDADPGARPSERPDGRAGAGRDQVARRRRARRAGAAREDGPSRELEGFFENVQSETASVVRGNVRDADVCHNVSLNQTR